MDKMVEAICLGTSSRHHLPPAAVDTLAIACAEICSLDIITNHRLMLESHVVAAVVTCNYCVKALQHIRQKLFITALTVFYCQDFTVVILCCTAV